VAPDGQTQPASRPRVDVIVTNHDYGRFLRDAIDSALAQTTPPARLIVVDDGSTDDSREVIRSYGDRIVAVLQENGGQASAVNAGLARSAAEVVLFLDADDVLEPQAVERVGEAFAADPALARVHYRMEVIDERGRRTGRVKPHPHLALPSGDLSRATLRSPFDGPWMPTSGNAFASSALRRVLPVPEEYRLGADWYLVHVSALAGSVAALQERLARYRVHGANSHELQRAELDLDHVRATIGYARTTRAHLLRLAGDLGLPASGRTMASMSDVGNRMISLRLDRRRHPIGGDTRIRLLALGARACRLRREVRWPMKAMFLAWLASMAVVPPALGPAVAEPFLFPERRSRMNPLLGRLTARPS